MNNYIIELWRVNMTNLPPYRTYMIKADDISKAMKSFIKQIHPGQDVYKIEVTEVFTDLDDN